MVACTEGNPFEMAVTTEQVVGDPDSSPIKFIVDPEQETATGTLTAQIDREFINSRTLIVESLMVESEFAGVGTIRLHLNPNFDSTATVFKLNRNNEPNGVNTMTLFIIIETPDQNLTYDNVQLIGPSATLILEGTLPVLTFQLDGEAKVFQTLNFSVVIPAGLITSDEDPN